MSSRGPAWRGSIAQLLLAAAAAQLLLVAAAPPPPVDAALCIARGSASGRANTRLLLAEPEKFWLDNQSRVGWGTRDSVLVDKLVERSVAWANRSTVAVGCLGGSGSRGLAQALYAHGVYMGHCLNQVTMDCSYFNGLRPSLHSVLHAVMTGPANGSLDYELHQIPESVLGLALQTLQQALQQVRSDLRSELRCYYRNLLVQARVAGNDGDLESELYSPPFHAIGAYADPCAVGSPTAALR